ncbi:MAG: hypothetical protein K1060chlam2_00402 [Chlamydiae bacterium]|nr:hypothetical protein [Chlamydiota bacterium]
MRSLLFLLFFTATACASQKILYDRHFSPYAGSADLLFAQELLIWGEDALFDGSGRDTTTKVWGRAAEQLLFWYNINLLASITQHEIFGHGYRLRELGVTPEKYQVTPWGGYTAFEVNDSFLMGELLAVDVAGLEAEGVIARDLKMQWIRRGEIDGRLGALYTQAEQSLFWYTLITQLGRLKGEEALEGNDVESYIAHHNASYPDHALTIGELTRWSVFNWLDPMTFYAYFAFFYYIAEGKSWSFPMIPLGDDLHYLPNIRIAYAPYSPEAYLENFFSIRGEPLYFYIKGGRKSFGVGVAYNRLIAGERGELGLRFDGWNQRVFLSSATVGDFLDGESVFRPVLERRRWGAAASLTMRLNLFSKVGLYSELGWKTSGYLSGYGLKKEVVGRVGITIGSPLKKKNESR